MQDIRLRALTSGSPELTICASWRAEAFAVLGASIEDELRSLQAFVADPTEQVALVAVWDGAPAGTCLLVRSEIEPVHAVSPWLAGLYVAPGVRRHGVGAALVRAIEDEARRRGHARLFLYTSEAAAFYRRLGWAVIDRTRWKGLDTALMAIDL